jgi:glycosyltransferase involved in cell wall biosynthesis
MLHCQNQPHTFVLFISPNTQVPAELGGFTNVIVKVIPFRHLWTQVGLAWETWKHPPLDVLWIPAHTLPVLRKPGIKTVVTIHGLEYQWLPEYKNLLQRWYLPLSTFYAAKSADTLIAVSQFTAQQLQKELHTSSKKIKVIHEGVRLSSRAATPAGLREVMAKFGL